MKTLFVCRVCLSSDAAKDISNLKSQGSEHKTGSEMLLFCLNIKVDDAKISTKLCLKCYRKIMTFYRFKLLALKSDAYLKNLESAEYIKSEIFSNEEVKIEAPPQYDTHLNKSGSIEIKQESDNDACGLESRLSDSDDELLSDIKKIKYEFIPIEVTETKENDHLNTNKGQPEKIEESNVCEECGKSVKDLKRHIRQLHDAKNVSSRVSCSMCTKTFSSHLAKSRHIQRNHMKVKKTCPICNKGVKNLKDHTIRIHKSSELRYECAGCGKRFISASVRDCHARTHAKDRPHACDLCDKQFAQRVSLVQHKRQIHDKIVTHICQYCSKSFFTSKYLQRHLSVHATDRPYQCKKCEKAFKTSKALRNHRFTHEEKRHRCNICDSSFKHPSYLRAHQLTHTREKQYPCKYCGVKFHRSDHRKRHEFTAHEKHLLTNS